MTRVANENQGLKTTFVDLEHADEEVIRDAIRENTKVRLSLILLFSLN
jgi:cystathionine gamma-lyase